MTPEQINAQQRVTMPKKKSSYTAIIVVGLLGICIGIALGYSIWANNIKDCQYVIVNHNGNQSFVGLTYLPPLSYCNLGLSNGKAYNETVQFTLNITSVNGK